MKFFAVAIFGAKGRQADIRKKPQDHAADPYRRFASANYRAVKDGKRPEAGKAL
jgi:hypothetical protein